jgi:tetratricopeptide (TPR) repeat protein
MTGAERMYREVLRLDPQHVDALTGAAAILAVPPEGLPNTSSYSHPLSAMPGLPVSPRGFSQRAEELDRVVKQNSLDALMERRLRQADAMLSTALALLPEHVPALCSRGKVQCQLDNFTQAEVLFRSALRVSPRDWQALSNYGVLLVSALRLLRAPRACLRACSARGPRRHALARYVYQVYLEQGMYLEHISLYVLEIYHIPVCSRYTLYRYIFIYLIQVYIPCTGIYLLLEVYLEQDIRHVLKQGMRGVRSSKVLRSDWSGTGATCRRQGQR